MHYNHSGTGKLGSMFQRLEFLGDAVLSYLAMQHLYKITPPLNPGGLSKLCAELVCNQFLACVSIQIGLVKYIRHTDMTMEAAIGRFATWVQGYLASESSTSLPISTSATQIASARLFWNKGNTAPKTAGDVYESMLGAVFVDSQFDIHCVQSMFDITVISPWWWRFTSLFGGESMIYENPVAELRTLSYSLFKCVKIDYTYEYGLHGGTTATITYHNMVLAQCLGTGQRDAKKAAACTAVEYVNMHKDELKDLCDCAHQQKQESTETKVYAADSIICFDSDKDKPTRSNKESARLSIEYATTTDQQDPASDWGESVDQATHAPLESIAISPDTL
ncbi:hypothetical protein O5D80_005483 [Batrachochytrium dendrobatidis]|nr:hypothetical protein O5D80_005483 [Batrachochytrium dendrobatidis]